MERSATISVDRTRPLERLDSYLRSCFPAVSRAAIQRLIAQGHVRVNGASVKATHHPRAGESITIHWPEPVAMEAQPEAMPLDLLFEDEHLLVLNKPAGVVVHPAAGNEEHTLVNALLHHCRGKLSGIGGVARPGIIHRLDKDTTGCLVVARTDQAHLSLSDQFARRSVEKVYEAIVCGEIPNDSGEIRAQIARHPTHRKRMAVRDDSGREARTSYRVLERLTGATLLQASLHTGRTHQIRVHFQHLGFPVAGDLLYGARQTRRLTEATGCQPARQMLHARRIAFLHPSTGKRRVFEAPRPVDFEAALKALRRAS